MSKLDLRKVIMIDSESTCDLFCNPAYGKEVYQDGDSIAVEGTGGTINVNHKIKIPHYDVGDPWFDENALTNILALCNVTKQYRVTYDSAEELAFTVHRSEFGLPDMKFYQHKCGLYVWEPESEGEVVLVNTVEDNMKSFTKREIVAEHF